MNLKSKTFFQHATVAVSLLVLTLLLWLPFGINTGFWADEWPSLAAAKLNTYVVIPSARPLVWFPWKLAYLLSPNDLTGANLLTMLLIFGKGALCYGICHRLGFQRSLAIAIAAVLIILPADVGQFYLGALSIHVALFGYLLALYFFTWYLQKKRWYLLFPILVGLMISVGIYETGYPLILVTPPLLLFVTKVDRRFSAAATLWYLVPLMNIVRLLTLRIQNPASLGYQSGLLTNNLNIEQMI